MGIGLSQYIIYFDNWKVYKSFTYDADVEDIDYSLDFMDSALREFGSIDSSSRTCGIITDYKNFKSYSKYQLEYSTVKTFRCYCEYFVII